MTFDYNSPEYAAVAFESNFDPQPSTENQKTPRTISVKKPHAKQGATLLEDLAFAVNKARIDGQPVNPFLVGFQFDVKKSNGDKIESEKIFDKDGREIETRHTTIRYTDTSQFLKIYPAMLSRMFEMKVPAKVVLSIVLNELRENDGKDFIYLKHTEKYMFEKNGVTKEVSRATFYRGINELIALGMIAKRGGDLFWINPAFMFNGNRVTFAQRFIVNHEARSE
jgi:hypothetical protein